MTKINLPEPQRNRTGSGNFVNLIMTSAVFSSYMYVAIFKNAQHILERAAIYSESHQAPNYVQRGTSLISQHTLKRCISVVVGLSLFFNLLKLSTICDKNNITFVSITNCYL